MKRHRSILVLVGALAVLGAAVVLILSAVTTSSARISASTSGSSFFSAGTVDLSQPDTAIDLLFDTDGLYPGLEVSGCVVVAYNGSLPGTVRLHASNGGGTGLERFVELELHDLGTTCDDTGDGPGASASIFSGRLDELWEDHPDYDAGIELMAGMAAGDRLALGAVAWVIDDNDAQGRVSEFTITIEARP